ncbi:hypothetical protein INT46_011086 [Mucor plumbeus]|uniref:Uncharacterized protein n=1 Tax=Mucor plumbeus TaxID=97098 RepID=A0A8H7QMP5_9FUNG|nr:hypothetical protein INT46_011086 [Mucor plumbeus]
MLLSKKLTSRLSKVISRLNSSIEEFEFVTNPRYSQQQQQQGNQNIPILQYNCNTNKQESNKHIRKKKRQSMICPEDEYDLLRINVMLIEASKSWKQTHHRKRLMAFPSRKYENDNASK